MHKLLLVALLGSFCASAALAQTTPATPSTPATNPTAVSKTIPKVKAPAKARSAVSLECSKQADAKGLHGKARKTYRAQCKKDMKTKA